MHQLFIEQLPMGVRELALQAVLEYGELLIGLVLGVHQWSVLLGAM
jgi:hypothetical protein